MRVAAFGGPYSNPYALKALLSDASRRGCERIFCLGDLGGFGAEPDALWPLLLQGGVECIAGNYDVAIGRGEPDCGCGYRDPRDNEFAQIAYDYTRAHTSDGFAAWMRTLRTERRETIEGIRLHLVHGSPLGLNDFLWESLPEPELRRRVEASGADLVLCTHSGLPWQRRVDRSLVVNVGVLGRPANDGCREVWYAVLDLAGGRVDAELVPLAYDWAAQAASMRAAGLPEAFTETIETGWWTTCLQILPPAERARGRFHVYRSELDPAALDDGLGPVIEDEDPDRPVVPLFGTALFPRRLWLAGEGPGVAEAVAGARREGFLEVRPVRPDDSSRERGSAVPVLTLSPDGWFWDPAAADPLAPAAAEASDVKRLVTERLLATAQAEGTLPGAFACA
ncbi:MAG TPA: metallophosphoesterase family protein [Acidimicrobiales bacterium]